VHYASLAESQDLPISLTCSSENAAIIPADHQSKIPLIAFLGL